MLTFTHKHLSTDNCILYHCIIVCFQHIVCNYFYLIVAYSVYVEITIIYTSYLKILLCIKSFCKFTATVYNYQEQLKKHYQTSPYLHMPENGNTLSILPFSQVTNVELYDILETTECYIKSCLNNKHIPNYIKSLVPDNLITKNCKYYTCEELCNINRHDDPDKTFKLIHHNIRSLDLHFGELLALISSLGEKFDLIALSEIGTKNILNREKELNNLGYEFKHKSLMLSRGGVGHVYNKNYNLIDTDDLIIESHTPNNQKLEIENIWLETDFLNTNDNYVIGVIYKHPGSSVE